MRQRTWWTITLVLVVVMTVVRVAIDTRRMDEAFQRIEAIEAALGQ